MQVCILDGNRIHDRDTLHAVLKESLGLPEWYGRNLDALYDCLTDMQEDTEIQILHEKDLKEHLGSYFPSLIRTLCRASEDNFKIRWNAAES